MITKNLVTRLILIATTTLIATTAHAQTAEQNVNVTIRPSQTVEEKVANEFKEKELRKTAEEKLAAEEAARIAETSPKALLRRARVVYVVSSTSFFEKELLQNALRKRKEFDTWQIVIVDGYDKRNIADVIINIDRPLFTYTFTYTVINRGNGIVLATGKVTAFDGNFAAPRLAERIIEDLRVARGESKGKK